MILVCEAHPVCPVSHTVVSSSRTWTPLRFGLVLLHRPIHPFQREGRENIGFGVRVPTVADPEPPQSLGSRGPLDQQMRMLGINLHRHFQEMKRPNRSGRTSAFNGQPPLYRAAYVTKQSVVGALVRAALARQRETKQQSKEWNHTRLTRGDVSHGLERLC
jgi:hypothetical protein